MSEPREPYITSTAPIASTNGDNKIPLIVSGDDWRYNMLLALEQQKQAGLMLVIDADAHCWYRVGRLECNKSDRVELPFKMQ